MNKTYIEYLVYQRKRSVVITHDKPLVWEQIKQVLKKKMGIKQISLLSMELTEDAIIL